MITARLKAQFNFDLDYSIRYQQNNKDVKEKCVINYKVRYPNGTVTNYKKGFTLTILQPGNYTIEYSIDCNGNTCASGIKYIRCDEQIVCNCGTPNDLLQITVRETKNRTYTKNSQDSVMYKPVIFQVALILTFLLAIIINCWLPIIVVPKTVRCIRIILQ
jgi:hypothetical protein